MRGVRYWADSPRAREEPWPPWRGVGTQSKRLCRGPGGVSRCHHREMTDCCSTFVEADRVRAPLVCVGVAGVRIVKERRSRGQAITEFVLILPVMLLILLVAIDFGRLFFTYVSVNNAAREAAAYAAMHARDTTFDQATYEAGVTAAAAQEANVQGQGGEGAFTVDAPVFPNPTTCHAASDFAGGIGNQVSVAVHESVSRSSPRLSARSSARVWISAPRPRRRCSTRWWRRSMANRPPRCRI